MYTMTPCLQRHTGNALYLVHFDIQSYPGYPYLGYPKPRLSERSYERGVCLK